MPSISRNKICVLLLAAVLLAPWAAAAEPGNRAVQHGTWVSWDLLSRLWSGVAALWGNNGCLVGPFGQCRTTSSAPEPTEYLDNGCHIDPYGVCREGS